MDRREALLGVTVMGMAAACRSQPPEAIGPEPRVAPSSEPREDHASPPGDDAAVSALHAAVYDCIEVGDTCAAHCQRRLAKGDTSMSDCAATVADMLAVMGALSKLLASRSKHHVALTKVAIDVCRSCEAACKVHAGHHTECKACMEACTKTIAAGEKIG